MAFFPPSSSSVSTSISYSTRRFSHPLYDLNPRFSGDLFFQRRHLRHFPLIAPLRLRSPPHASKRFSSYPREAVVVVPDPRAWAGDLRDDEDEEDDDEEEDDQSLDILVRFLHNIFRNVSRRARKAARSVLPPVIPTKLVGFSVNGVLVLAFL